MNIHQLKIILKQPLPVIISKAKAIFITKFTHFYWGKKYISNDFRKHEVTYKVDVNIFDFHKIDTSKISEKLADYLVQMYSQHRFDLLGSGWVKNSYHSEAVGLEDIKYPNPLADLKIDEEGIWLSKVVHKNHLEQSQIIWSQIIISDKNYQPIDWQKDYKVGFRFDAKTPYTKQIQLADREGVDLKMPWELSRLQHLPQMALFAKIIPLNKEAIILEFKNQVLDFIMSNPAGMGVNWNCTMDVGIRAANLLLAYDWFIQIDDKNILNDFFKNLFTNYIYSHGKHIVNNFEYNGGITSNHYLGNIAGLSFVASYLNGKKQFNNWYFLSLQELQNEMPRQFFKDGSNFEGSTPYHRLSGEMFAYSTIVVDSISKERKKDLINYKVKKGIKKPYLIAKAPDFNLDKAIFSKKYYSYFKNMVSFCEAYRKNDGNITQIGDNDSGRFFRLSPSGEFLILEEAIKKYHNLQLTSDYKELEYWDENQINIDTFLALLGGFFAKKRTSIYSERFPIEAGFFSQIGFNEIYNIENVIPVIDKTIPNLEFVKTKEFENTTSNSLTENIDLNYFEDFGMAVFKSDNLYLNVSFGNNPKSHPSLGHQHNDKLSVEININGADIVVDPGTYIYTPIAKKRNLFRSVKNHNTIEIGEEQNLFNTTRKGLFSMNQDVSIEILKINKTQIILYLKYRQVHHIRNIEILSSKIIIEDSCNKEFNQNFNFKLFSNGYGKLLNIT